MAVDDLPDLNVSLFQYKICQNISHFYIPYADKGHDIVSVFRVLHMVDKLAEGYGKKCIHQLLEQYGGRPHKDLRRNSSNELYDKLWEQAYKEQLRLLRDVLSEAIHDVNMNDLVNTLKECVDTFDLIWYDSTIDRLEVKHGEWFLSKMESRKSRYVRVF